MDDLKFQSAIDEIDLLLDAENIGLASKQSSDIKDLPVYHYCDGKALESILTRKQLRATHWKYLNDSEEFIHGVQQFRQALKEKAGAMPRRKWAYLLNYVADNMSGEWPNHHYVCCFSRNPDELSQWRGYASYGSGYAIGFDQQRLISESRAAESWRTVRPVHLTYDDADKSQFIKTIVDIMVREFASKFDDSEIETSEVNPLTGKPEDTLNNAIVHQIYLAIFKFSIQLKNGGFHEEAEFRLDITLPEKGTQTGTEHIKLREKNGLFVPYLEIGPKNDLLPITEIVIGPCLNFEKAKRGLEILLKQNHYDSAVTIRESSIPFLQ